MTAEVAVLNTTAVALAADSAISFDRTDKIYSSGDKLFQLNETAPVGIMINGCAAFLGTPWETIVKVYRQERQGVKRPTLHDYRVDFLNFVSAHRGMFPRETQNYFVNIVIEYFLRDLLARLVARVEDEEEELDDEIDDASARQIIHEAVIEEIEQIQSRNHLIGFDSQFRSAIRNRLQRRSKEIKNEVFKDLPMDARTNRLISKLVFEMMTRDSMDLLETELVFAGFGEDEYMPRLETVQVEIMIDDKIRFAADEDKQHEVTHEKRGAIIPFAQQEMVHTFLNGIHPKIRQYVIKSMIPFFHYVVSQLIDDAKAFAPDLTDDLEERLHSQISTLMDEFRQELDTQTQKHWRPIIEIVSVLPKDELGAMAEALVNLTKFQRRVSQEPETVGGPIDVAVITKGDGFIWVKRKHYYDAELNPRIMSKLRGTQ